MGNAMNTLPELWGLIDLIGAPVPGEDAMVNDLLADAELSPAIREVLAAAFLIAGYADPAAASDAGMPENASVIGYAHTILAGPGAKQLADAVMRSVDHRRTPVSRAEARALDLSYERLFSLTAAERSAQFRHPIALLNNTR